jgi:hypothetical protein
MTEAKKYYRESDLTRHLYTCHVRITVSQFTADFLHGSPNFYRMFLIPGME